MQYKTPAGQSWRQLMRDVGFRRLNEFKVLMVDEPVIASAEMVPLQVLLPFRFILMVTDASSIPLYVPDEVVDKLVTSAP